MEHKHAEILVEALSNVSDEYRIYEMYSGRNMYGRFTTGIVVPSIMDFITNALRVAENFVDEDGQSVFVDISNLNYDNLGRDYIIY